MSKKKYCATHVLIPSSDPEHNITDDQIEKSSRALYDQVKSNPDKIGLAAFQFSADVGTSRYNPELKECINEINPQDPSKDKKAIDCIEEHSGKLCFDEGETVKEFENGVKELKKGEVGFIDTQFGHHIIRRIDPKKVI